MIAVSAPVLSDRGFIASDVRVVPAAIGAEEKAADAHCHSIPLELGPSSSGVIAR